MNKRMILTLTLALALGLVGTMAPVTSAQDFDFELLEKKAGSFAVIIDMKIEVSFGIHLAEQSERSLGTIVSADGLVIFDGSSLTDHTGLPAFSGFTVKTNPVFVEVSTLDGKTYKAEYIGVERFTGIGFLQVDTDGDVFTPVKFKTDNQFKPGDWLALYMLLPEFITPPLAADVGMISTLVESPERFALTVGFSPLQITSVLFDADSEPVGVLGALMDPSMASTDASGLLESFGQFGVPLLGVIVAERLEKMIADPPHEGEVDRGWLGISLQALTSDMAEYWDLDLPGGIIVNEIITGSPADKSGLAVGDIIYQINGQLVDVDKEEKLPVFQRLMAELGPGAGVEMAVIRRDIGGADTLSLLVTLEAAPMVAADADEFECESLEFTVRNMVFADYMANNLEAEDFAGVVVSGMKLGGPANVGGLRIGDIVQRIGDTDIESIDDAELVMAGAETKQPGELVFFIWRQNQTLFVNVKTNW